MDPSLGCNFRNTILSISKVISISRHFIIYIRIWICAVSNGNWTAPTNVRATEKVSRPAEKQTNKREHSKQLLHGCQIAFVVAFDVLWSLLTGETHFGTILPLPPSSPFVDRLNSCHSHHECSKFCDRDFFLERWPYFMQTTERNGYIPINSSRRDESWVFFVSFAAWIRASRILSSNFYVHLSWATKVYSSFFCCGQCCWQSFYQQVVQHKNLSQYNHNRFFLPLFTSSTEFNIPFTEYGWKYSI